MSNEIWKPIEGFEEYKVSSLGRICLKEGVVARGRPHKTSGYVHASFKSGSNLVSPLVHRVVAQTFIPNPLNKPIVNHKNGNRSDNRVENLEWATASENTKHAHDTSLRKTARGNESPLAKGTRSDVLLMKLLHMQGVSNVEIARRFHATHVGGIQRIISGQRHKNV